jgi:hypothetical protein
MKEDSSMTRKLARWSWVLALPLSAVLASPKERAVEVPLNSTSKPATKSIATKSVTTTVKERSLSMRDVAPARPGEDGVYHSIHDWVPRTPTKDSQAQKQTEESNHAHRAHWWSRPQQVASTQKAQEVKP